MQEQVRTGPTTLCLLPGEGDERGTLLVTTREEPSDTCACWEQGCRACLEPDGGQLVTLPSPSGDAIRVISFPVRDREERFGVLLVDLPAGQDLAPWQQRLLAALAGHIGTALSLQRRMRESRRLILHEERSILARELHDSLAQSLSYLKIQVTRLAAALDDQADPAKPHEILRELREGISSAYRQLRELLTTFRLKMDDRGLGRALEETVQEMRARSSVDIRLDSRLPPNLLSPNEEIHVLQIVREALSNVIRHADARRADVRLRLDDEGVEVEVRDDGRGYVPPTDQVRHYGLTIMRERTLSLDGELTLLSPPEGGTLVRLRFRHRSAGAAPDTAETRLLGAA
jgi:two-component system nitrate/nitrite sensor histidine kinase NarX